VLATIALVSLGIGCEKDAPMRERAQVPSARAPDLLVVGDPAPTLRVWARDAGGGRLCVATGELRTEGVLQAAHDFAVTVTLEVGAGDHALRAWVSDTCGEVPAEALVREVHVPREEERAVRFGFGGDVAGQNVCRHAEEGFPLFETVMERELDFFVGLGDMIYADGVCEREGRWGQPQVPGDFPASTRLPHWWAHWRYAREDPALRRVLESMPYVAVWDDHEVVNDFDSAEATLPLGLRALRDHNPLPETLHRAFRWGRHLELIVLDTRQHRARNDAIEDKSMLGETQREWLSERLRSDATWKVVVSSVPISIPTGGAARDGWSDLEQEAGFEAELRGILEEARDLGARMFWIATDVHFASVFRYEPFEGYVFHEGVTGPMNAGMFAHETVDPTFAPERLFWLGPERDGERGGDAESWEEARGLFNFGEVAIAEDGALTFRVIAMDGVRYELRLAP